MIKELHSYDLSATLKNADDLDDEGRLHLLEELIDEGFCVPMFVGQGVGHWIALWGYDPQSEDYVAFDVRKKAKRDERGLTRYSKDELMELWRSLWLWRPWWGAYVYIDLRP